MPLVPSEPGREDWLHERDVCRAWGVRRSALRLVAEAADVPYELRGGRTRGRGTYGAEAAYRCFPPEQVRRVAEAVRDGSLRLDASWRTDTPQGRAAERRERRSEWLVEGLFFGPFLLLVCAVLLYAWLAG